MTQRNGGNVSLGHAKNEKDGKGEKTMVPCVRNRRRPTEMRRGCRRRVEKAGSCWKKQKLSGINLYFVARNENDCFLVGNRRYPPSRDPHGNGNLSAT